MIRNLVFTVSYDGTNYSGWQSQPQEEVFTIQDELEKVLSILCAKKIKIEGCSRTDAGVHSMGQVFRLLGDFSIPTENILRAANNLLPSDITITNIVEAPLKFHPRFDCQKKTYTYRILNCDIRNPFTSKRVYHVNKWLDLKEMRKAARYIEGKHDFACFQSAGGEKKETTVRTIFEIEIDRKKDEIVTKITGDGFLYNMVRIIMGTLVEVGLGKIEAKEVKIIIKSKDRTKAGHTAPPFGLCLEKIYYDERVF